jgi:hypothetical protein
VVREQRHLHVLGDRHRGEGRRDLKGAPDAEAPMARGASPARRGRKCECARRRRDLAVDHVEAGALARAVRADQRQHLAGLQREAHALDRLEAG